MLNTSKFIYTINSRLHTKPQALDKTFGYKGNRLGNEVGRAGVRKKAAKFR